MDLLNEIARWAHVFFGVLAFAAFWTAVFARKGARLHRRAGTIYVRMLSAVLATAGVLTLITLLRGNMVGAIFGAYLLTITGTSLWMGKRTLRFKGDVKGYTRGPFLPIGALNILAASGTAAVGLVEKHFFVAGISIIGFLIGFGMFAMHRKPPDHPRIWLKEHIGGMTCAGIATHIAFASIGLRQFFPEANTSVVTLWPWLAPLVIGFVAGSIAEKRYVTHEAPLPNGTRDTST